MYESVSAARPLPRGRHNLPPEQIEADQRRRMLAAMPAALAEHGYARTTVAHVLEQAGVSRRTFYQQFDDKEACLLAAYDEAERRVWAEASAAAAGTPAGDWEARVEAALAGVLGFVAAEPETARLFTLEARAAGPAMAARHNRALDRVAAALRAGNRARREDAGLPAGTERALVGNVAALVGAYVLSGATELLPSLAPQLAGHLLSPYRDEGAADPRVSSAAARGPR
jgi:AcrR family transcriptional regulator